MTRSDTPTIALFAAWLDGWYQSQLWRGVVAGARLHNVRLLTIVGYAPPDGGVPTTPEDIYGLAARRDVDAALESSGPLSFWEGPRAIERIQGWLVDKPLLSLGQELPAMDSVAPDGEGIEEMTRHLIETHGCRRIAYLGGPTTNLDALRRREDFLKTCAAAECETAPDWLEASDFTFDGGDQAMERIIARMGVPDAVVAANDAMAMGAIRSLRRRGLDVPADVRVTGYDDSEEARSHHPSLTTIRSPTRFLGVRGVERLLERLRDRISSPRHERIATTPVVRKSCGCLLQSSIIQLPEPAQRPQLVPTTALEASPSDAGAREAFLRHIQHIARDAEEGDLEEWTDVLVQESRRALSIASPDARAATQEMLLQAQTVLAEARQGLQGSRRREAIDLIRRLHRATNPLVDADSPAVLLEVLENVAPSWCPEGLRLFLHNADFGPAEQNLSTCSFALREEFRSGGRRAIPDGEDLLPAEAVPGETWTAVPLQRGSERYGVALLRNWTRNEAFVEHFRLSLSLGIQQVWKHHVEARLRERLAEQSTRDELTGLLNRRGLRDVATLLARKGAREARAHLLFAADLDGLKPVNDLHGHAAGDEAIRLMADAIRECFRATDTPARMGGDEFSILCAAVPDANPDSIAGRLREILERRCAELGRAWRVSTSIGWAEWNPADDPSMEHAMARADRALYEDKIRRKSSS